MVVGVIGERAGVQSAYPACASRWFGVRTYIQAGSASSCKWASVSNAARCARSNSASWWAMA